MRLGHLESTTASLERSIAWLGARYPCTGNLGADCTALALTVVRYRFVDGRSQLTLWLVVVLDDGRTTVTHSSPSPPLIVAMLARGDTVRTGGLKITLDSSSRRDAFPPSYVERHGL